MLQALEDPDDLGARVQAHLYEALDSGRGGHGVPAGAGPIQPELQQAEQQGPRGQDDTLGSI